MLRCGLFVLFAVQALAQCPQSCKCTRHFHFVNCIKASLTDIPLLATGAEVTILNLSNNNITKLPSGIFQRKNLSVVTGIDLFGNNITIIDSDAFRGLSEHLLELTLRGNPFIKLPEQGFKLETLIILDLSDCNLESIHASFFQTMRDIMYLYLSDNKLTFFDPNIIAPSKGLQLDRLALDNNKLTKLDRMLALYHKTQLWIDLNPFHCDCEFLSAYSVFAERGQIMKYAQPRCQTPAHLEGVTGGRLLKMKLRCAAEDGKELVPSLDDRSWWFLHQWWILTVCALALVLLVALVHVLQNLNSFKLLENVWCLRNFANCHSSVNNPTDGLVY